jgi:hypothetical protein
MFDGPASQHSVGHFDEALSARPFGDPVYQAFLLRMVHHQQRPDKIGPRSLRSDTARQDLR